MPFALAVYRIGCAVCRVERAVYSASTACSRSARWLPEGKTTSYLQSAGNIKAGIVVNDLDAALRELERRQVTIRFRPFADEALGSRTFAITDNEGNIIQFFGK